MCEDDACTRGTSSGSRANRNRLMARVQCQYWIYCDNEELETIISPTPRTATGDEEGLKCINYCDNSRRQSLTFHTFRFNHSGHFQRKGEQINCEGGGYLSLDEIGKVRIITCACLINIFHCDTDKDNGTNILSVTSQSFISGSTNDRKVLVCCGTE